MWLSGQVIYQSFVKVLFLQEIKEVTCYELDEALEKSSSDL